MLNCYWVEKTIESLKVVLFPQQIFADVGTHEILGSQDPGGNSVSQVSDMASGKKEISFRRTSSCSDSDSSEPLFIDMLKSNTKKNVMPETHTTVGMTDSTDGMQGGRGGKKKGKKGRQIDPALLGFKVTSNRIMMGEIQRLED